ncbi:MAG: hypothetical protein SFU98_16255 [Leptospiraceae bacterium]|nr:hypothetical protein [Leptospiraceae bacterium]
MKTILTILFTTSIALSANTFYVQSPIAQLLPNPVAGGKGTPMEKGASVKKEGEQDMFYKVSYNGATGWVNKIFLSTNPPTQKASFGAEVDKSTSVKARARASSFTQTAAARGYSESQTLRTRGAAEDYDLEAIGWLEKLPISDKEISDFESSKKVD